MRSKSNLERVATTLLSAAAVLLSAQAAAASGWRQVAPAADDVVTVAVSPSQPQTLLASRSAGIYRSTDAGATWALVYGDLFGCLPVVTSFAFDPSLPRSVYAAMGNLMLVSNDEGATWQAANNPGIGGVVSTALVPGAPGTPSLLLAASGIITPVVSPTPPCTFQLAETGLVASRDQGATWFNFFLTGRQPMSGAHAVASDPGNPGRVYVGTAGDSSPSQVLWTDNFGATVTSLPNLPTFDGVQQLQVDTSTDPSTLYVVAGGTFRAPATPPDAMPDNDFWTQLPVPAGPGPLPQGLSANTSLLPGNLLLDPNIPGTLYSFSSIGVLTSANHGDTWTSLDEGLSPSSVDAMAVDPRPAGPLYAATPAGIFALDRSACLEDAADACLNRFRFRASVSFQLPGGQPTPAHSVALSDETTAFWFFDPSNLELMVKVLDGGPVNGSFWVFGGALTDVQYTLTITDSVTGAVKTYTNPAGRLASFADVNAFASTTQAAAPTPAPARAAAATRPRDAAAVAPFGSAAAAALHPRATAAASSSACAAGAADLCLLGSRFQVSVAFKSGGTAGFGQTVPLTDDTGGFWFTTPNNLELMIKVIDGRPLDGHFWVFYGALSDVAYTLTITDTMTGAVRTYSNPQGTLASFADTAAF